MLIHFDHSQSLAIIFIENGLNTGRFSGTCITEQQNVISFFSADKCFRVLDQLLLLCLVSNNIFKIHMFYIDDRINDKLMLIFFFNNTECLI